MLDLKSSTARGLEVFRKKGSVCHRVGDMGHQVPQAGGRVKWWSHFFSMKDTGSNGQPSLASTRVCASAFTREIGKRGTLQMVDDGQGGRSADHYGVNTSWENSRPILRGYKTVTSGKLLATLYMQLWTLALSPPWASTDPSIKYGTPVPKKVQWWAEYVRQCVSRYKDDCKYWEIWNEPNPQTAIPVDQVYSGYFKGTIEDYVELLKAAYITAKRVDPQCKIVGICGTGNYFDFL